MSLQIDNNSGFHLVYCFPTSLIVSLKYHHFTNKPANHCCQSLNVYRPPKDNFQVFNESIAECLDNILLSGDFELFVIGDFNIDLSDTQNPNSKTIIETFQHYGLCQHILNPTHFSKNSPPSLIDHIYSNSKYIKEHGNITLNISDHDLVYTVKKRNKLPNSSTSF